MKYELAFRLKQAGFPQRKGMDGADVAEQISNGYPTYVCAHRNKCSNPIACPTKAYFPSAQEIFEQCNRCTGVRRTYRYDDAKGKPKGVYAFGEIMEKIEKGETTDTLVTSFAPTLREALAHLYIDMKYWNLNGESSKGRTGDFESPNGGSIPSSPANNNG